MKIVMTLLVRDEEDIIRENIEFHRDQGVDFFIVTDNRSVDATTMILKEFEAKGLLHYIYEGRDDFNQHIWVTRMARLAFTNFDADWVINNDADEFWWPVSGSLKDTFEGISPQINLVKANRSNFVVVEDSEEPFWARMVYRNRVSLNATGNVLPPKIAHQGLENIIVNPGNHSVDGIENPKVIDGLVEIFHFPIRSYQQIVNKITKGGGAYERNENLPSTVGITWRVLYRDLQRDKNLTPYFKSNFYDKERLAEMLSLGELIKDERLTNFLKKKMRD